MVKTMRVERAGRVAPARNRSYKWHEEQYRTMQVTVLPDGCSSQDFADKCNLLTETHLPYFKTIRLEKETLSAAFLEFLPANLKTASATASHRSGHTLPRTAQFAGAGAALSGSIIHNRALFCTLVFHILKCPSHVG